MDRASSTLTFTLVLPDGPQGPFPMVAPELLDHERVIVGGGSRRMKINVAPEVFARMLGAEVTRPRPPTHGCFTRYDAPYTEDVSDEQGIAGRFICGSPGEDF